MVKSLRAQLTTDVAYAIQSLIQDIPSLPSDVEVQRATRAEHGDYACAYALRASKAAGKTPLDLAEIIANRLQDRTEYDVEIAKPGYLNFRLKPSYLRRNLLKVLELGDAYGKLQIGQGIRTQVEFVSANPTGPLHVGHGRGGALGDAIANVLSFVGYEVEREFYVNDYGNQTYLLAKSIIERMKEMFGQVPHIPEGGYQGEYVKDLAKQIRNELTDIDMSVLENPKSELIERIEKVVVKKIVEEFKKVLGNMGIEFDRWFYESKLWEKDDGEPSLGEKVMDALSQLGYIDERDGALWFVPPNADEGERYVVRRSKLKTDNEPNPPGAVSRGEEEAWNKTNQEVKQNRLHTYLASDIAYAYERFIKRGFESVVCVWGADHHGHVKRVKQAIQALGIDPERLKVVLVQMVHVKEAGKLVQMSKREGEFVTLRELIDRVGKNAARYFFLMRSPDSTMEFDIDLATQQSMANPVYYAQYAHARLANVLEFAQQRNLEPNGNLDLLSNGYELDLMRQIAYFPDYIEDAANLLEPHRLCYYLQELSDKVHAYYQAGNDDPSLRIVSNDSELSSARLVLCKAAKQVLRNSLCLLGVDAPERM